MMIVSQAPTIPDQACYTQEDHAVMRFRYSHYFQQNIRKFSIFVGESTASDDLDADIMYAMAKCCDTLREFDRMRTDYLIEECLSRL